MYNLTKRDLIGRSWPDGSVSGQAFFVPRVKSEATLDSVVSPSRAHHLRSSRVPRDVANSPTVASRGRGRRGAKGS